MSKIRVLYIHQDGLVTGSAISLKYFLQAMDREKFEPIVLLADEGPARQLYEELNIKVHVFKFATFWTSPGPNWYSPRNLKQYKALIPNAKLRDKVKELKPDIIHINDKAALNAGISTKKLNIPIVQHSRSTYQIISTKLNKFLSVLCIKSYYNFLISISEDELDGFIDLKKTSVINNPVLIKSKFSSEMRNRKRSELGIKESDTVIGFIGQVSAFKGAWYFLDLIKELTKKCSNNESKFIIAGRVPNSQKTLLNNGNYVPISPREYINGTLEVNNLSDKVIILGFEKDVLSLYHSLDILIALNKFKAMGRQPIEAQALGVPVVVTQGHSRKSKVVKNGEGGIVISSPVNMDELVEVVEKLIKNPELRKEMGEKGKAYAKEKFDPVKNMRKIEEIYMELLNEKKGNDSKS